MVHLVELFCLPVNAGQVAASATGSSALIVGGEARLREQLEVKEENDDGDPLSLERDLDPDAYRCEFEIISTCDDKGGDSDYNSDPAPIKKASKRRKVSDGKSKSSKVKPKKVSAKQKLEYKKEWETWCAGHVWKEDSQYHQLGQYVRHKTDAICMYGLKDFEFKTLPFVAFENKYNPSQPGKSYCERDILVLLCRKMSMLAGLGGDLNSETFQHAKGLFRKAQEEKENKQKERSERKKTQGKKVLPKVHRLFSIVEKGSSAYQYGRSDNGDDFWVRQESHSRVHYELCHL